MCSYVDMKMALPFLGCGKIFPVVQGTAGAYLGTGEGTRRTSCSVPRGCDLRRGTWGSGPQFAHLQSGDTGPSLQGLLWNSVRELRGVRSGEHKPRTPSFSQTQDACYGESAWFLTVGLAQETWSLVLCFLGEIQSRAPGLGE